jgi:hypothetical protein
MPPDEKQAVWQSILGNIPAGAPGPSNGPNNAAASSLAKAAGVAGPASLLALKGAKVVLVVAVLAGLGASGYHWFGKLRVSRNAVPASPSAPVSASVILAPLVASQAAPEPPPPEVTATSPAVLAAAPSRASQLKEESLAVMAARQALRSNDAAKALSLLDQAKFRFKRGGLAEEREALTIEALAKLGEGARASALARAFLAQYPRSPHAADVQRFAK